MIKNELVKFFTPLKIIIYGGLILAFILLANVIFGDTISGTKNFYDFAQENIFDLIIFIPIILTSIVSEIFTYDYESGCMKFFIMYKSRNKVLFSKIIALILITLILIVFAFLALAASYIIKSPNYINILSYQMLLIMKMMMTFLIALTPILLIYVMISILFKSSTVISLLIFLLVIMSDFFPKVIGEITPRRFLWVSLIKGNKIDGFSIILFAAYLIIFIFLDIKLFSKKEMLH